MIHFSKHVEPGTSAAGSRDIKGTYRCGTHTVALTILVFPRGDRCWGVKKGAGISRCRQLRSSGSFSASWLRVMHGV